ncbi:MAG: hypothetical protein JXM69_17885 [Anaerolineae bacterium]|nr:hypothetical protein [Anaerolineae bacterium]
MANFEHYSTQTFGSDRWAIHYYAHIEGHELLTRKDLIPTEPNHKRANTWYYQLQLGPLQHKLPPIVSHNWRRITFIVTTGDRFETAEEINDLFEKESPAGRLYVTLKEADLHPERDFTLREGGVDYVADLAIPLGNNQWLPVTFAPVDDAIQALSSILRFSPDAQMGDCLKSVQQKLAQLD